MVFFWVFWVVVVLGFGFFEVGGYFGFVFFWSVFFRFGDSYFILWVYCRFFFIGIFVLVFVFSSLFV